MHYTIVGEIFAFVRPRIMRPLKWGYLSFLVPLGIASGLSIPNPPDGTNIYITESEDSAPIDRAQWFEFSDDVFMLSVKYDVSFEGQRALAAGTEIAVPVKGSTGDYVDARVYSRNGIRMNIHGRFQYTTIVEGRSLTQPGFPVVRARGALLPFLKTNLRIPKDTVFVFVTSMAEPAPPPRDNFLSSTIRYWKPKPPPWVTTVQEMQRHALALNGILDSQNGYAHSSIDFTLDEDVEMKQTLRVRGVLAAQWDVHSREELIDMLVKLQNGEHGHRKRYWEIRQKLLEAKMEHYLGVIDGDGPGTPAQRFIVATHLRPLKGKTLPITAWDFWALHLPVQGGIQCPLAY
jgi:hypothetical protein